MSTSNAVEVAQSRWADSHPEHDRDSCSDADAFNADPAGSNGCARCTALRLDRANIDAARIAMAEDAAAKGDLARANAGGMAMRIAELRAGLIECLRLWPGNRPDYPGNDGSPDLENADDEALIFLLRESIECVMPDEGAEPIAAPQAAERQYYYYRESNCKAANAVDADCICWHDEGSIPLHLSTAAATAWREKPRQPAAVKVPDGWSDDLRRVQEMLSGFGRNHAADKARAIITRLLAAEPQQPAAVPDGIAEKLAALRADGWVVAVHNDYKLNGEHHTFWLFTRDGRAIKGEGRNDAAALRQIMLAAAPKPMHLPLPATASAPSDGWTVLIAGPDDLRHCASEFEALRMCNAINKQYLADRLKNPDDEVLCVATAAPTQQEAKAAHV